MKKYLLLFLFLLPILIYSQDTIYKTDGTEIQVKVVEITTDAVKYKKFTNLDGPVYNVAIVDIFMIVYENGEREVYKKKEVTPPPPPPKVEEKVTAPTPVQTPIQKEEPNSTAPAQSTSSSEMTMNKGYQHTGLYASFSGGLFMPQTYDFEKKVDGATVAKGELTNIDSKFKFVANAVWQQDHLAFVFGGVVDSYDFGYMTFYYVGLNYYFILDSFSPYGYLRAGYGLGKNDEPLVDKEEEISLTGPYAGVGAGCKIYLDKTWGLTAEFGYQYNSNGIDDKLKIFDRKRKYEFTADVSSLALAVGFFFYP